MIVDIQKDYFPGGGHPLVGPRGRGSRGSAPPLRLPLLRRPGLSRPARLGRGRGDIHASRDRRRRDPRDRRSAPGRDRASRKSTRTGSATHRWRRSWRPPSTKIVVCGMMTSTCVQRDRARRGRPGVRDDGRPRCLRDVRPRVPRAGRARHLGARLPSWPRSPTITPRSSRPTRSSADGRRSGPHPSGSHALATVAPLQPHCVSVWRGNVLQSAMIPSGTPVLNWTVPAGMERNAYVADASGARIAIDFQRLSNLTWSAPAPRCARLSLATSPHLHALPDHPNSIPTAPPTTRSAGAFA